MNGRRLVAVPSTPSKRVLVREVIHHGDYYHVREIELPSLSDLALLHLLRSSPYMYAHGDTGPTLDKLAEMRADLEAGRPAGYAWSWFTRVEE